MKTFKEYLKENKTFLLEKKLKLKYIKESNLLTHAENEINLHLSKIKDKEAYNIEKIITDEILELMKVHSGKGHSGSTHAYTIEMFNKLVNWKPLSPITNNPNEWTNVSEMSGYKLYQNKRDCACFTNDFKTYYNVSDDSKGKKKYNF